MLRLLTLLAALLGERQARQIGTWLGRIVFSVLRIRRRITVDNIRRALGLPAKAAVELAQRVYEQLGMGAMEFLQLGRMGRARARQIMGERGLSKLRSILDQGKGMLVLTAHLGSWDVLACATALSGLRVNVVTREIKSSWINRFWMSQRSACGVQLLSAEGSARRILRALRANEIVALVLDQHEVGGMAVPFFGRPAATGLALARLARATGAPVVPVFLVRREHGFRLDVQDPVCLRRTGSRQEEIIESTRHFTEIIERRVRESPEQWLWLHRRWKLPEQECADIGPSS